MSLRKVWLLFGLICAIAAGATTFVRSRAHFAWSERVAQEWLRNTWDQGGRAYDAGVIAHLRDDAMLLGDHLGSSLPEGPELRAAVDAVWSSRHDDEHWIRLQGDRVTSSRRACAADALAPQLRERSDGVLVCGDVPLLVATASAPGDGTRWFAARELGHGYADALHLITGAEVVLVTGGRGVATSYRDAAGGRIDVLPPDLLARVGSAAEPWFEARELSTPGYRGYTGASEPILVGAPSVDVYVFAAPLETMSGRDDVHVVMSAPRELLDEGVEVMSLADVGFTMLMVILVLLLGHVIVRQFERTLHRMTGAAESIGHGVDGVRVGRPGGGAELDRLGVTLDTMAEKLERFRARQTAAAAAAEARAVESARALEELQLTHEALRETQVKLVDASRLAGMAEVATNVLHNVGNVLNTINVAADVASRKLRQSRLPTLERLAALVPADPVEAAAFLADDPRGRQVPQLLRVLAETLRSEHDATSRELVVLERSVDHIKHVVRSQQEMASYRGGVDLVAPSEVLDVAIALQGLTEAEQQIEVVRDYVLVEPILLDRHRTMQVILNLLANARQAIQARGGLDGCIVVRLARQGDDVRFEVSDDGIGIAAELRERIFQHGFTTRPDGHGFGLHGSANAAAEMGGTLSVHSNGIGCGATFVLKIPLRRRERAARPRTGDAPRQEPSRPGLAA